MRKLERRQEPLLPRPLFVLRLFRYLLLSGSVIAVSLLIGVLGYRWIGGLDWVDSILNASMILTGMGPVDPMKTTAAKLFASAYALFSGIVFLCAAGVLVTPVLHRLLHHFHVDMESPRSNRGAP
jgi:hypothetical protein